MTNLDKGVLGKIEAAVKHSESAYACAREAGQMAAKFINKSLPFNDAVDALAMAYREHFTGNNASNLFSNFKDSLIVTASPKVKVVLPTKDGDAKPVAVESLPTDLAKGKLQAVAKQVRAARGLATSNANGTGTRKATSEAAEKPKVNVAALPMTAPKLTDFALVDRVAEAIAKPEWRSDLAQVMIATLGVAKSREALAHLTEMLGATKPQRKRKAA